MLPCHGLPSSLQAVEGAGNALHAHFSAVRTSPCTVVQNTTVYSSAWQAERAALANTAAAHVEMQPPRGAADAAASQHGSDSGSAGGSRHGPGGSGHGPGANSGLARSPAKGGGDGGGGSFTERPGSATGGPRRRVFRADSGKMGAAPAAVLDGWRPAVAAADHGNGGLPDSALTKAETRAADSRGGTMHGDMCAAIRGYRSVSSMTCFRASMLPAPV